MDFKPYDYQRTGIEWILGHPRCCLLWEMGLGKSVVTLTALQQLIDCCEIDSALVVAPKKVAEATWGDEVDKWEHLRGLKVVKVIGTEKQRCMALSQKADVYVIGRDSFVWLVGHYYGKLPFDMLVIDELTSFKSPKSARFKAMRIASSGFRRVVGLTGTPAPNGMIDLWAQMYCIDQGERLGKSVTGYRRAYFDEYRWNGIIVRSTIRKGCEKVIRDKIADICLCLQAKDYLQLPPVLVHTVKIIFSEGVRRKYEKFERDKVLEFQREHGNEQATVLANSAAGLMNKLSQFANGAVYDDSRNAHPVHNEKMERLQELVEAAGSSVLVFYQFRHDADRIEELLGKEYRVRRYEGPQDLENWNSGKIDILLAHPASTAYGLNMQQGGHYIVWFGLGWNLEHYQQANARLYRQGQQYPVTVYRLVCAGTVDERMVAALDGKKSVQQGLLDSLNYLIRKHDGRQEAC